MYFPLATYVIFVLLKRSKFMIKYLDIINSYRCNVVTSCRCILQHVQYIFLTFFVQLQ